MLCSLLATYAFQSIRYIDFKIEAWTVHVESELVDNQKPLWSAAEAELRRQFQSIDRVVPDGPLSSLHKIQFWIHVKSPETIGLAYHPGAQWLVDHKMNPAMAKGIEIGIAKNFVSWSYEQPWCVLHELAHSYHNLHLAKGFENEKVLEAYRAAMKNKIYESVRYSNGGLQKAYATTNQMEYFAELSEAYFGTNDFYPFVKAELTNADPKGFELMESIWGQIVKKIPDSFEKKLLRKQ